MLSNNKYETHSQKDGVFAEQITMLKNITMVD